MTTAIIGGVFTLIVAIVGVFSQGTRARSRKEVEELVALRKELAEAQQAQVDQVIAWRIEGLHFITNRPRYWVARIVIIATLLSLSYALEAASFHYDNLAGKGGNSIVDSLPRVASLEKERETLAAKSDKASKDQLAVVEKALATEIEAQIGQIEDTKYYLRLAKWLSYTAIGLIVLSFGILLSLSNVGLTLAREAFSRKSRQSVGRVSATAEASRQRNSED